MASLATLLNDVNRKGEGIGRISDMKLDDDGGEEEVFLLRGDEGYYDENCRYDEDQEEDYPQVIRPFPEAAPAVAAAIAVVVVADEEPGQDELDDADD
ncbi:unnamed protein product [Nezara viridula]|uniref:Uncharacterized protein n=1 Tax=Nezara viridula TaxID=85310 RepID=A0A9P0MTJ5_NEZVI|nr:unnamed protein product [Nezara viridula]